MAYYPFLMKTLLTIARNAAGVFAVYRTTLSVAVCVGRKKSLVLRSLISYRGSHVGSRMLRLWVLAAPVWGRIKTRYLVWLNSTHVSRMLWKPWLLVGLIPISRHQCAKIWKSLYHSYAAFTCKDTSITRSHWFHFLCKPQSKILTSLTGFGFSLSLFYSTKIRRKKSNKDQPQTSSWKQCSRW